MSSSPTSTQALMKKPPARKLRSACDFCHRSKIRCSGGTPCAKCSASYMEQLGKPKGSRNKKTMENAGTCAMTDIGSSESYHSESRHSHVGRSREEEESRDGMHMFQPNCRAEDVPDFQASDLLAFLDADGEVNNAFEIGTNAPDWYQSDTSYITRSCTDMPAATVNLIEDEPIDPGGTLNAQNKVSHEHRPDRPQSKASRNDYPNAVIDGNYSDTLAAASAPVEVEDWSEGSCDCLQNFGNHISRLDRVERQRHAVSIDQSLHSTSLIMISTDGALQCSSCRLNPRMLLLVMMALGTVLSLVQEGCKQQNHNDRLPQIQFGGWRLSYEDTILTRDLLIGRIITKSQSFVETLQARVEELSFDTSKSNVRHGFVEMNTLQKLLCRVSDSLSGLAQSIAP